MSTELIFILTAVLTSFAAGWLLATSLLRRSQPEDFWKESATKWREITYALLVVVDEQERIIDDLGRDSSQPQDQEANHDDQ